MFLSSLRGTLVRRSSTSEGGSDKEIHAFFVARWITSLSNPDTVIPGWSAGPDLRCAIAHRGISRFRVRCFASPRNDGVCSNSKHDFQFQMYVRPRDAMRPRHCLALPPKEGVGNAGCPWHPRPRVHLLVVERTRVTTSTRNHPASPHAMVLTVCFVLSPAIGLFCHRRLAD